MRFSGSVVLVAAAVCSSGKFAQMKNGVLRSKICKSLSVAAKLASATCLTKLGAWSPAMATMTLRPVFSYCSVK